MDIFVYARISALSAIGIVMKELYVAKFIQFMMSLGASKGAAGAAIAQGSDMRT